MNRYYLYNFDLSTKTRLIKSSNKYAEIMKFRNKKFKVRPFSYGIFDIKQGKFV